MSTATLRTRSLFPLAWPTLAWLPLTAPTIRIEEFSEGTHYVVRAELPGVDPGKDVHVTVADGMLRIKVERADEHATEDDKGVRSEFHYGSLYRQIPLPAGAAHNKATASYDKGILEIRVAIEAPSTTSRDIPITVPNGKSAAA